MPDGPPKGWQTLQERAQRERDPKKLAAIIDEMNRLLTEQEKAAEKGNENILSNTHHKSAGD